MNTIKLKLETKIKKQTKLQKEIEEFDLILENYSHLLTKDEIVEVYEEKEKLQSQSETYSTNIDKKYQNFFYSIEDIKNAPTIQWLIEGVIAKKTIGVFIGKSGSGKSTVIAHFCKKILSLHSNTYIIYIDGDMDAQKIKESEAYELMKIYKDRFKYAGKSVNDFSKISQELLRDTVTEQMKHTNRFYIIIEDSLSLTAKKRRGFIDTESLYKYERKLREYGGTSLIIHHTNKSGVFADTQHIENFADYTYMIERNEFNSCVLLHPQKASRYDIQPKAFLTKDRIICNEVNYEEVNVQEKESEFIRIIIDLLEDGEMNQSEVLAHLNKIRYFTEFKVGQKKAIKWLQKYAEEDRWEMEKRPDMKNSIYYYIKGEEGILENLPKCETTKKRERNE